MGDRTGIEWTDATWNPVRGCTRVSEGCRNCYAERLAARMSKPGMWGHGFAEMTQLGPRWTGRVELLPARLDLPMRWREPRRIFVSSTSDVFHEELSYEQIAAIFAVMAATPQHTYQVLTKRPGRMAPFLEWVRTPRPRHVPAYAAHLEARLVAAPAIAWPLPNVWLGVSVEDQETADERIPLLLQAPAAVRFVSYEPALAPVTFRGHIMAPERAADCACGHGHGFGRCPNYGGVARTCHWRGCGCTEFRRPLGVSLDWIIIGGESGPGARAFDIAWARSTITQCRDAGVACFVKQLGARPWSSLALESYVTMNPDVSTTITGELTEQQSEAMQQMINFACLSLRDRKGGDMAEWPQDLRVREFPRTATVRR